MGFLPLETSDHDHVVVSVSTDFQSNSWWDILFHCIAYDYSCADWDGHPDHLRDVPWENMFKLSASDANYVSRFRLELICISFTKSINPHSSPWFSASCPAAMVHRNHFFPLYQQNKSFESKVKF